MQYTETRKRHIARVAELAPNLVVGSRVLWRTGSGNPFGNGGQFTVVAIELDHNHLRLQDHSTECYCRKRVEVTIAHGLQPDGSATLRLRVPVRELTRMP